LTGTKHSAYSTNHLDDTDKTKHNHSQHENLNNHERKLLIYAEMKANKLKPGAGAFYAT